MARRVFAAGTVTSTGAPQVLRFYTEETGGRPETDLSSVDYYNYPDVPVPNGKVVTTADGAYASFVGPDDVDELWREVVPGEARSWLLSSSSVTGSVGTRVFTTVNLPDATGYAAGVSVFDSTANVPVWSTGTVWVDALGDPYPAVESGSPSAS